MNWRKGSLWIIIFFIVKGTFSTLLIITGAKYFNLTYTQILLLVFVLLIISYVGRKYVKRRKSRIRRDNDVSL